MASNTALARLRATKLSESFPRISSCDAPEVRELTSSEQADALRYWRDSGVPERHSLKVKHRHNADGPWGETYRRLRDRVPHGPLLVLLGRRGTGKTQMAVDLLADICRLAQPVRYLVALDLFREIRACYRADGPDEVRTIHRICRYGGLVIDEAHERSDSDWENRTLTNIIAAVYSSH